LDKYEDLYNVTAGTGRSNIGQGGREQGIKKLMTVNLLKRLESSIEAFRLTLIKIEAAVDRTLTRIAAGGGSIDTGGDGSYSADMTEFDDDDALEAEPLLFGKNIRIDLRDVDVETW